MMEVNLHKLSQITWGKAKPTTTANKLRLIICSQTESKHNWWKAKSINNQIKPINSNNYLINLLLFGDRGLVSHI